MQMDETNSLLLGVNNKHNTVSGALIRIGPKHPGAQEKEAQSTLGFHYQRKKKRFILQVSGI